jgi:hypothetical protein
MAHEKMDRGELPRVNPQRIWVHPGTWERCAVCSVAITESETGYEVEFTLRWVSFWGFTGPVLPRGSTSVLSDSAGHSIRRSSSRAFLSMAPSLPDLRRHPEPGRPC